MVKKFVIYLSIVFVIMWGYIQNRYDFFLFGFITLALAAIDLELVNRMDTYFRIKVRSLATKYIISLLLLVSVCSLFNVHQTLGINLHIFSIGIYGLSIATYVTSVILFYMSYK